MGNMMNLNEKRSKYSYIYSIWMSNAPGPEDLLSKWIEKKWFTELHKLQDYIRKGRKLDWKKRPTFTGRPNYTWQRTYPTPTLSVNWVEPDYSETPCKNCQTPKEDKIAIRGLKNKPLPRPVQTEPTKKRVLDEVPGPSSPRPGPGESRRHREHFHNGVRGSSHPCRPRK